MPLAMEEMRACVSELRTRVASLHRAGTAPLEVAAALADGVDELTLDAWKSAWNGSDAAHEIALVASGGYGRRMLVPFSDLDLLVVLPERNGACAEGPIKTFIRSLWDAGFAVGQNVATGRQLAQQARTDAALSTGLLSARRLAGPAAPLDILLETQRRHFNRTAARPFTAAVLSLLAEEHGRFGATAQLLEPNIKRSAGGLRHIDLVSWFGLAGEGTGDWRVLEERGLLGRGDAEELSAARDFLLRCRCELHVAAGKVEDTLTRAEQIRIAELWGYHDGPALLAVEQFMRDVLRHTSAVQEIVERFLDRPDAKRGWRAIVGTLGSLGKNRLGDGLTRNNDRLELSAARRAALADDLANVLDVATIAADERLTLDAESLELLRRTYRTDRPLAASAEACRKFVAFLSAPGGRAKVLRQLHEAGILRAFLPEFETVRSLIQFNAYHRYTVDEHTLVAFEQVEALADATPRDLPAEAYARVQRKDLLHLAVLLHDLGKGRPEDHSEVGERLAWAAADRFGLPESDRRTLGLLVRQHLLLSRVAFQRDIRDDEVLVDLVKQLGTEDVLHKLYALTVVDVRAVSPEAYTQWKADLLADLYRRLHAWFGTPSVGNAEGEAARAAWVVKYSSPADGAYFAALPADYLSNVPGPEIERHLAVWRNLDREPVHVSIRHAATRDAASVTAITHERVADGVFHRLCGALAAHRLEVLSADILTLPDGTVFDRFEVRDVHHSGPTSTERQTRIAATVRRVLLGEMSVEDALWATRSALFDSRQRVMATAPPRVEIDNESSATHTVVDVFANDRRGLLYTLARAIFSLGLSVGFAKIATYEDEVVDVFYVQEADGRKATDPDRQHQIRAALIEHVERLAADPRSMGF